MCLLAVFFRAIEDCPVLVAANREEFYDRQGTPPELWPGKPAFVAGRDPQAGGTWLGVNRHGVLVAVTNRPKRDGPAQPPSRGLLCRDLLACRTARQAHERALEALDRNAYAGCNLLAVDAAGAYVVHAGEVLRSCPLPPGIHVVTSHDLNDTTDPRIARALEWLNRCGPHLLDEWLEELSTMCRDHGTKEQPPICLHHDGRGTVSSSIVALSGRLSSSRWLHAQGPPCQCPHGDYSALLQAKLNSARAG